MTWLSFIQQVAYYTGEYNLGSVSFHDMSQSNLYRWIACRICNINVFDNHISIISKLIFV